jgi:hypothetical protein
MRRRFRSVFLLLALVILPACSQQQQAVEASCDIDASAVATECAGAITVVDNCEAMQFNAACPYQASDAGPPTIPYCPVAASQPSGPAGYAYTLEGGTPQVCVIGCGEALEQVPGISFVWSGGASPALSVAYRTVFFPSGAIPSVDGSVAFPTLPAAGSPLRGSFSFETPEDVNGTAHDVQVSFDVCVEQVPGWSQ